MVGDRPLPLRPLDSPEAGARELADILLLLESLQASTPPGPRAFARPVGDPRL
jgi:hypothetical protein